MKRLPLLMTLLLFMRILPAAAQEKNPLLQSGILIDQGRQLYDSGQYKKALAVFQKVDYNDTNYVHALYEISLCFSADSQFNKAVECCQRALALKSDPERVPDLYNQYGNAVDATGSSEEALKIFDSALLKYPAYSLLYLNKGTVLIRQKRFAEAEAIYRKVLLMDPYSYSSHFKLGVCALSQGKLLPAFLSFTAYLLMTPEGRYRSNCIALLSAIAKNEDIIQQYVNDRKEPPGEDYQLLEQILQSKIALDKNYKPLIHLDDAISRQIQVVFEKMEYQESDPDFWMQYYIPYFKSVYTSGQFENFINHIFSGVDVAEIKEYNKKNKKEISALVDKAAEYFNLIRASREINYTKRNTDTLLWDYSHGTLAGKGKYLAKEDKLVGPWEFYFGTGNLKSKGSYNDQGKKTGLFEYYYFDGTVKAKELFRDGKLDGEQTYYFYDGTLSSHESYKDNLAEGETVSYFLTGGPHTITNYRLGKKDGVMITFSSTGDTTMVEHYKSDELDGEVRTWHSNKMPDVVASYSNGNLDGPYAKYYNTGQLNMEGLYKAGKQQGLWKFYHPNGQLKSQENLIDDKQDGEYKEFFDNGQVNSILMFKKGKLAGEANYFDEDGKPYAVFQYDKDVVQKARYFDKTGKTLSESVRNGKTIDITGFLPEGTKRVQMTYNGNGQITGMETFFYPSGKIFETDEYKDGQEQGPSISYYPNGQKKSETPYTDGKMDGYYQSWYSHGEIKAEGWYRENSTQGYWLFYNALGDLTDSNYYFNGEPHGFKTSFWPNGKKQSLEKFRSGWLREWTQFDSTGKELHHSYFPGGEGKLLLVYPDGKPWVTADYVHGQINGKRSSFYYNGQPMTEEHFQSGLEVGIYKSWGPSGTVTSEGNFKNGIKVGEWKQYFPSGKLRIVEQYAPDGKLSGRKITYNENGNPESDISFKDDLFDGYFKQYDTDGSLAYQLTYKKNKLIGYAYPEKTGGLHAEILLVGETGKFKTYFANGAVSAELEFQDGYQSGVNILYHSNGKIKSRSEMEWGDRQGAVLIYHENGQLKAEYHYIHGNMHGPYKEYNDKGIETEEGIYYCDDPHGPIRLFDDNGKPKETDIYYYGKLLSIKK